MKMLRIIRFSFPLLSLMFFASCDYSDGVVFSRSFVMNYVDVVDSIPMEMAGDSIWVYMHKDYVGSAYRYDDSDKGEYDRICEKNGDMTYNASRIPSETWHTYPSENWTSISVVSEEDYDAGHPAGSDLSDVIIMETVSPYPFISRGYKGEEYTSISRLISELSSDDLKLIGDCGPYSEGSHNYLCYFHFSSRRDIPGDLHLTFTIVTETGRKFVSRVLYPAASL